MDDFTSEILAGGGKWAHTEIDGDQAIVRLRASDALIARLRVQFRPLSETEARSAHTPTRRLPRLSADKLDYIFTPERAASTDLDTIVREVPEVGRSGELTMLISLWMGVGFGLGWRLPIWLSEALARTGLPPIDGRWLHPFFNQWGAFPTLGTIDDFNRVDESPLSDGGKWSSPMRSGIGDLRLVTNRAAAISDASGNHEAYRSDVTYGPDTECFATFPVIGTTAGAENSARVHIRTDEEGAGNADGFMADAKILSGTDTWRLFRMDNDTFTQIGTTSSLEIGAGDKMGLEGVGTTITGYRDTGGGWGSFDSATDAAHNIAGHVGLLLEQVWRGDDFGGGTVVAAGNPWYAYAQQ